MEFNYGYKGRQPGMVKKCQGMRYLKAQLKIARQLWDWGHCDNLQRTIRMVREQQQRRRK